MKFIDLQKNIPKEYKIYEVLIRNTDDTDRKSSAKWTDNGFELLNDSLKSDSYVVGYFI